MQKSRARQPGHQRGVLHRIPHPVAPPAQHRISPVRAQQNPHPLEAPGDHGPAARQVNPLLPRITAQQRGQRESKRDGETGVAGIQNRRMDDHLRILQQRIETIAIGAQDPLQGPAGRSRAQYLKGAGDEIVQRQEKKLHAHQDHANVRHQLGMFAAVGKQNRKNINRQQKAPEKQRALLPRPDRREFKKRRESAVAVLHHVSHGEVVGQKKIRQAAEPQPDKHANRHARMARALDQQRTPRDDRGYAPTKGIESAQKGQKQCKRSKQVQRRPS